MNHAPDSNISKLFHPHKQIHGVKRLRFGLRGFLVTAISFIGFITWLTNWSFLQAQSSIPHSEIALNERIEKWDTSTRIAHSHNHVGNEDDSVLFHFIISSECSSYQLWETITSFHAAESIRQCGRFTWIISGCLANDQLEQGVGKSGANSDLLTPLVMQQHIDVHFPPFRKADYLDCSRLRPELHFTPDYSNMSVYGGPYADGKTIRFYQKKDGSKQRSPFGNRYVFNNKPNGLLHWAMAREGEEIDEAIVLIDPDFLFLSNFHLSREDLTIVGRVQKLIFRDRDLVFPGQPAAASYGLGAQWLEFDLARICGYNSHCVNTTKSEVHQYYSAGPPYIIHRQDVLPLAAKWAELVPATYDEYPLLYAEMYAYSMAASHLQLKHNLVNDIFTGCMVSWPNPNRWAKNNPKMQNVEKVKVKESAMLYRSSLEDELSFVDSFGGTKMSQEQGPSTCFCAPLLPPPMLHYCQRYFIEATPYMRRIRGQSNITYRFFAKRRVEHNTVLACNPDTTGHPRRFLPFESFKENERLAGGSVEWNTLAVCAITRALNFAKAKGCSSGFSSEIE